MERPEDAAIFHAAREGVELGRRRPRQEDRVAGAQRVDHRRGVGEPVRGGRQRARLGGQRGVGGIGVGHGQAAHAAVAPGQVHHAPVGVLRDHELGHGVQRRLVVERGRQRAAHVGQQPRAMGARLGLAAGGLLAEEDLGVAQRDGRVVGQAQ